jgi:DNA recombination protein RmuC
MLWELVAFFVGGLIGGAVGYLLADRRSRSDSGALRAAEAAASQRASGLAEQVVHERSQGEALRAQVLTLEKEGAARQAQLRSAEQSIIEQKKLLDDAHERLREAFTTVSADVLKKNNEAFLDLAKQRFETLQKEATGSLDERKAQIDALLKPMREVMNQYQTRLVEIEKSRVESYSMLREQLGTLAETQRTLHTQTNQLVSALRRPQTRGQWGEITLRRLIELAGMTNRCDFYEQESFGTDDSRLRPDVVVRLPGGREIVIDCKAVLDAFLDAAAAVDEENRKICLKRHCEQVKSRVRDLSSKKYWDQLDHSPEFVVMFLPGEAFLYAAAEIDVDLIEDSLKSRVILATPTTLMALLKAIEFGWRQEDMTVNAEKIRELGVELYERVATLAGHMERVGANVKSLVASYNSVVGSMESRVMVTARKMGELGAKTDKELPDLSPVDQQPRELSLPSSDP